MGGEPGSGRRGLALRGRWAVDESGHYMNLRGRPGFTWVWVSTHRIGGAILGELMNNTHNHSRFCLATLLGLFASGCASGAYSMASRPPYLAQASLTKCEVGEPSMNCCIKKYPLTPAESCGATAADIAEAFRGAKALNDAAKAAESSAKATTGEDDPDEGWREHCQDMYVLCRDQKKPRWEGPCDDCLRNCHGQKQWPFHWCHPKEK